MSQNTPVKIESVTYSTPTHTKETTVSQNTPVKIESVTFVTLPGQSPRRTKDVSDDELISGIAAAEKAAAELSKVETTSAAIAKKIEALKAGAAKLAEILDARKPAADSAE